MVKSRGRQLFLLLELLDLVLRLFGIVLVSSLLIFVLFLANPGLISRTDFVGFITGARVIKTDFRTSIYDVGVQTAFQEDVIKKRGVEGLIPFRNPPTLALFFIPFTYMPLSTSYKVFAIVNVLSLFLAINLLTKFFNFSLPSLFLLIGFTYLPSIYAIVNGQVTIFLFIVFIFILNSLRKGKFFLAGLLTAFLFNKPQYLIFVPFAFFLSKNKFSFFKGFFLGMAISLSISFGLLGRDWILNYGRFLVTTENPYYATHTLWLVSLFSFFEYLGLSKMHAYLVNLLLYLSSVGMFLKRYKNLTLELAFFSSIFFIPVFALHFWEHDLVFLLLPMLSFLTKVSTFKQGLVYIGLFAVLFLLPFLRFVAFPFIISIISLFLGILFLYLPKNFF